MISAQDRFIAFVNKTSACWLWTGAKSKQGYGAFYLNARMHPAHRAAYILFVGPIPRGLAILHSCDVPACVNPDHLKPGTHADNMRDAALRGRLRPMSKLRPEDVVAIRAAAVAGTPNSVTASTYKISTVHVRSIVSRKTWKHF